jgi:hypothetical protein
LGTGVIFEVASSDNKALIMTNYHVIEGYTQVTVTVNDSTSYMGTVLGYDANRDLAVVSICCSSGFKALSFGDASNIQVGSEVIAIGYALGVPGSATVTRGIVSAVRYESDVDRWVIQTDAPINPGNSGGPLLSAKGEILGINTYVVRSTGSGVAVEGFGFAVSTTTVLQRLAALKQGSVVSYPTPTPLPQAPGGIYTSEKYWYSIKVPSGWRLDASDFDAVAMWDPASGATVWIQVKEVDPVEYPSLTSYVSGWRPAAASAWTDFVITDKQYVRTDKPIQAYQWTYRFKYQDATTLAKSQWYVLGRYAVRVTATADEVIWGSETYRAIRTKLEEVLASFEPATYTNAMNAYSLSTPKGWSRMACPTGYEFCAYESSHSVQVATNAQPAKGHPTVESYGSSLTIPDGTIISRGLLYTARSNPSYRIDYRYIESTTGKTVRVALLITLSRGNVIGIMIVCYQEQWTAISNIVDDIFLRFAVVP